MDILEWLKEMNVPVAIWIIGIAAVIITIIDIYKNGSELIELGRRIGKGFRKLFSITRTLRRRRYNKALSTEEYLEWQKDVLHKIYLPVIEKYNAISNLKCTVANRFGYEYDAVYFAANPVNYPFKGVAEKDKLGDFPLRVVKKGNGYKIKYDKKSVPSVARKYYKLLKSTIHFPDNIGYMLDKITFGENSDMHFSAYPSTYLTNVYTSNAMEYELYKFYKKLKRTSGRAPSEALHGMTVAQVLKALPMRSAIHDKVIKKYAAKSDGDVTAAVTKILTDGAGRASLLGVQAMVFCKNKTGGYDVLRIRRSENVDAKAGFLQFIPSGGFSALDSGIGHDTQVANFSLSKAILRELLEECFGEEDFSGRKNQSAESIYSDPVIKSLNLLENGGKAFSFIGTALNLANLRHELCFVLEISDFDVIDKIRSNEECDNVIQFISADRLKNEKFWIYNFGGEERCDHKKLNPTSAALWNLVEELQSKLQSKDKIQ